eukprot:5915911-Pyramimonas_sp.AAC.1
MQELHGSRVAPFQNVAQATAPRTFGCQGTTVTSIRGAEVPRTVIWHDSGSPRPNSQVNSCR